MSLSMLSLKMTGTVSSRQRSASPLSPLPSSSAQRHFSEWLQQPAVECCTQASEDFIQEDECQRLKLQQIILQALRYPGGCYRDQQRLIHRMPGIALSCRLLNGPLVGLLIRAEMANGQLYLSLSVSEHAHHRCLLSQRPNWLKRLKHCGYPVSIEISYLESSAQ